MYILGISSGGESGAALFHNNQLICASNEERFSRVKLDTSFPTQSIHWCLEFASISPSDIHIITYGFSIGNESTQNKHAWLKTLTELNVEIEKDQIIQQRVLTETEVDQKLYEETCQEIAKIFGHNIPIIRYHHHFSHAAAAYYPSGMKEALIVTADGRGDYRSLTIAKANETTYEEIYCAPSWYSLGYFYGRMTKLCGFRANRHEGKVTGLAAFGNPHKALDFVKKMIYVENGQVISNLGDYYRPFFTNYSEKLIEEAKEFSPEDLAAATQYYFEEMFTQLVEYYIKETQLTNLCLAGGVFSNIKLNQSLYEINKDIDIFVYPNMGDGGICVGSCYAWLWENKQPRQEKINTMYLGYEIQNDKITHELHQNGYQEESPSNLIQEMINRLSEGSSIGIAQGRTEFGPRALGNRTILASPTSNDIIQKINKQLGRDTFMPLAPIMPIELAKEYIIFRDDKSFDKGFFMTMTYNSKPILKDLAEAIVHVDGTIRPQFITKESNPFLHKLLLEWYNQTGCPALINTSFNAHEEPIVNSEKDIVSSFCRNVIDSLAYPPYIVHYKG